MAGEVYLLQPGLQLGDQGPIAGGGLQQPLAVVGAGGEQLLAEAQPPAGIEKHQALEPHRQQGHGGMGPEAALTGDRQAGAASLQGQLGLGGAGLQGAALSRDRAAETAELIGIHLVQMQQLGAEPMAQGSADHPLLAVARGQGNGAAGVGTELGQRCRPDCPGALDGAVIMER